MGWPIGIERKGCDLIIHDNERDFCVTMVGWVDVPDSDRDDFRRRRAVNVSSYYDTATWLVVRHLKALKADIDGAEFYSLMNE